MGGGSAGRCIDGSGGGAGQLVGHTLRNVAENTTFGINVAQGNFI